MSRLQPRPKSLATANISSQGTPGAKDALSKAGTPPPRQNGRISSADAISDRATIALIRRTLCSQFGDKGRSTPAPIHEILPPLTSSNEVDLQLYALIAIIIREFVQTWYAKITPDQVFVEEVIKIIAHITRALEQRLRDVDLESLIFDELPDLLDAHVQAFRASQQPRHPPPFEHDPRQIYHSLWPFPALSPIPNGEENIKRQMENEANYRQLLIQGVLAVLLPTEDLENDCLTALVGQILSEMILGGGIGGKACEPWLLWEGITKIAEVVKAQLPYSKARVRLERSNSDLVVPGGLDLTGGKPKRWNVGISLQKIFWLVLQYGFLAFTAVRFFIITIATASSLPSRVTPMTKLTGYTTSQQSMEESDDFDPLLRERDSTLKQPILKMKLWSCVSNLLDLEIRMPWLSGTLSMLQWAALTGPGEVGKTDGMVDKILSHAIHTHILDPKLIPTLLRTARAALFPFNTLAPPRIVPTAPEQLLIRRRCAEMLLSLVPARAQDVYYGGHGGYGGGAGVESSEDKKNRIVSEVEEVLDCFGDVYCNKHLLYAVVELVVVRLVPEIAEMGVKELLGERLM